MNLGSRIARTLKRLPSRPSAGPTIRSARRGLWLEPLESRTLLSANLLADPTAFDPTRILVRFRSEAAAVQATHILPGAELGPAISLVPGAHGVRLPAGIPIAQALQAF